MNERLPHPESVLRASAWALLGAIAVSGVADAVGNVDLAEMLQWAPGCVFRSWTGIACPGCGMAHALVLIGQLELAAAFAANPAAPWLVFATALTAAIPGWRRQLNLERWAIGALALLTPLWLIRFSG